VTASTVDPADLGERLARTGIVERLRESVLHAVDAEDPRSYGLIVAIGHQGAVDFLVRQWPAGACARKLREAADELDRIGGVETTAIDEDTAFERELDTRAGGGW